MRSRGTVSIIGIIGASAAAFAVALSGAPAYGQVQTAGELFVSLDANDASAGTDLWANAGTLADFARVGNPTLVEVLGAAGVEFNAVAPTDAYQCQEIAPAGLVGEDPTRSIEAWVYNQDIAAEETICAWSHRGGPCGTNMSFNYGSDIYFGAVGHWCHAPGPDIGWGRLPVAAEWHHLVYTYDGTTTRVYADGVQTNEEVLGNGAVITHDGSPIVLGAQYADATPTLDFGANVGTLVIGRLRVHDEVLTPEQIKNNHDFERPDFPVGVPAAPAFGPDPVDEVYLAGETTYSYQLTVTGFLPPTLEVLEPAGGAVDSNTYRFTYAIPAAEPASFVVRIRATNDSGTAETTWTVTKQDLPPAGQLAIAGELFVDLDAEDATAGTDFWDSRADRGATLGPFEKRGNPIVAEFDGSFGVLFNETARVGDSYVCTEIAPPGIVGLDPTRTIETWVYNPAVDGNEETILSFGRRGGPDGSNMSFNYAGNAAYGAVGHWGAPDIGWDRANAGAVPEAARWHHLVYTYDGTTTRLYSDGEEWNSEVVGAGVINTWADTPIALAAQWDAVGVLNLALGGDLAIARVRVHDGVLRPNQVKHNFETEIGDFYANEAPVILDAPASDTMLTGTAVYSRTISFRGYPNPTLSVLSPAGGTITPEGIFSYTIPSPEPDSFDVAIRATNTAGFADATWTVTIVKPGKLASGPVHRYPFTLDATDEEGGADGTIWGNVVFADGQADFQNTVGPPTSGAAGLFPDPADPAKVPPGAYIDLPNGTVSALGTQATFEAWFTWRGPATSNWQRIFDFGTSNAGEDSSADGAASSYAFLTPRSGSTSLRAGYRVGATAVERVLDAPVASRNVETHVAVTWDDETTTARLYVNGALIDEDIEKHINLADLPDVNNWLGRSQFNDPMYNGLMNEFRIYNRALSHSEVLGNFRAGPDVVNVEGGGGPQFRRGDANADGGMNITDGIFVLNFLFLGGTDPTCMDAADSNDDAAINITDGIYILNYLFLGGGAPPAPGPDACGDDPSAEDPEVTCDEYLSC